jgi:acyl-CoA thioesterase
MGFDDATTLNPAGPGRFGIDVPQGWEQGRGAWGGLVAALVVKAVRHEDPRPVRTVSLHLPAPLAAGPSDVVVTPLRVGSALTTTEVRIEDDQNVIAHAVVVTGEPRAGDLSARSAGWGTLSAPEAKPWQDVPAWPQTAPGMPVFLAQMELRAVQGIPVSGGPARCTGYARFRDEQPWDEARLLALADVWLPTALVAVDSIRPMATITFAAHLLADPRSVPTGEPLLYDATLSAAHEGYTTEVRRLWTLDGRLVVENQQSIVIVR